MQLNEKIILFEEHSGYDPITHKTNQLVPTGTLYLNVTQKTHANVIRDYGFDDSNVIQIRSLQPTLSVEKFIGYNGYVYELLSTNSSTRTTSLELKRSTKTYTIVGGEVVFNE